MGGPPGLVQLARDIFDEHMKGPHQLDNKREDVSVTAADLIKLPEGTTTEAGLRQNVSVGVQYVEAWLRGAGCVPLYNLMEDAATAEISRTQLWQWVKHGAILDDGRQVTTDLVSTVLDEELSSLRLQLGDDRFSAGKFDDAKKLFVDLTGAEQFEEFLTLPAYAILTRGDF